MRDPGPLATLRAVARPGASSAAEVAGPVVLAA